MTVGSGAPAPDPASCVASLLAVGPDGELELQMERELVGHVPRLRGHLRREAVECLQAAAGGAFDLAFRVGREMKRTGAAWGVEPVADVGAALARAARGRDPEGIRILVEGLREYLDRVTVLSR